MIITIEMNVFTVGIIFTIVGVLIGVVITAIIYAVGGGK